jgi:hypothetical protein
MNQEKVLAALAEAQRVHPEMSYDERWNLVMSTHQKALPGDLGAAARARPVVQDCLLKRPGTWLSARRCRTCAKARRWVRR